MHDRTSINLRILSEENYYLYCIALLNLFVNPLNHSKIFTAKLKYVSIFIHQNFNNSFSFAFNNNNVFQDFQVSEFINL